MMSALVDTTSGKSRSRTIGYILDVLHGYQETLWREASRESLSFGSSLVTFLGQSFVRGPALDVPATNKVFDLAFCPWIDSYLMSGATLGTYVSKAEYAECLKRYRSRPAVSIGPCGEGIPAVEIENRSGIKSMVLHLAKTHDKKRIAYVSGPEASAEASERLAGYKEGLRAAGLAFDPALVYAGNFWYSGGEAGVREFLEMRKVAFDALVAANDYMALGAMRELLRSEERRVGKECRSMCRSRWSPYH
jgi:sigma-B regulation protein RsbU (phosphoserine phosphatase)